MVDSSVTSPRPCGSLHGPTLPSSSFLVETPRLGQACVDESRSQAGFG